MPIKDPPVQLPDHKPISLRVYPATDLGFDFPVAMVDIRMHPKLRVLDLACDIIPDECLDEIPDDDTEYTLVFNGEVLDGEATLGDALFPRLPKGRRTTVVLTKMPTSES